MNRFVIIDGLPYLHAEGRVYAVRFDDSGFTLGEEVKKAFSPYPSYFENEIKAKCTALDSIGANHDESKDEKSLDKMTVAELKEYAEAHDISLDGAKNKSAIIEVIKTSIEQAVS